MKYAYTGQKHPFFWVLAPGLPLFTVSFKRYPANTAAFHCRSGEQHQTTVFSPHVRESKTVLDSGFHAMDSRFQGTGFQIQWDLDTRFFRQWDSGFLELFSGFQSPGFWCPLARISPIPGSRFPYKGRVFAGYSPCLRYQHHGNRQECSMRKHPFLLALRRWGLFLFLRAKRPQRRRARRNGFFRRLARMRIVKKVIMIPSI